MPSGILSILRALGETYFERGGISFWTCLAFYYSFSAHWNTNSTKENWIIVTRLETGWQKQLKYSSGSKILKMTLRKNCHFPLGPLGRWEPWAIGRFAHALTRLCLCPSQHSPRNLGTVTSGKVRLSCGQRQERLWSTALYQHLVLFLGSELIIAMPD